MTPKDETDLRAARAICAQHDPEKANQYLEGQRDDYMPMTAVRAALSCLGEAGKLQPIVEGATDNGAPPLSADELAAAIARYATPATPPSDHIASPEGEREPVLAHLRWWQQQGGDREPGWLGALIGQIESGEHMDAHTPATPSPAQQSGELREAGRYRVIPVRGHAEKHAIFDVIMGDAIAVCPDDIAAEMVLAALTSTSERDEQR